MSSEFMALAKVMGFTEVELHVDTEMLDITTFGDISKTFMGMKRWTLTFTDYRQAWRYEGNSEQEVEAKALNEMLKL